MHGSRLQFAPGPQRLGIKRTFSSAMDRSISRFLGLPIFDDSFRSGLRDLKMDHVEFWLAMSDDDFESADEKFSSFLPALTDDREILDKILVRLEMVNLLADMVARSSSRVQAEIASDLGYGSAEPPRVGSKRVASQVIAALQPPGSVGVMPAGQGSAAQVSSIQDAENAEKKKWGRRLSQICDRAGSAADQRSCPVHRPGPCGSRSAQGPCVRSWGLQDDPTKCQKLGKV